MYTSHRRRAGFYSDQIFLAISLSVTNFAPNFSFDIKKKENKLI